MNQLLLRQQRLDFLFFLLFFDVDKRADHFDRHALFIPRGRTVHPETAILTALQTKAKFHIERPSARIHDMGRNRPADLFRIFRVYVGRPAS